MRKAAFLIITLAWTAVGYSQESGINPYSATGSNGQTCYCNLQTTIDPATGAESGISFSCGDTKELIMIAKTALELPNKEQIRPTTSLELLNHLTAKSWNVYSTSSDVIDKKIYRTYLLNKYIQKSK